MVDFLDQPGPRQAEHVVEAFEVLARVLELLASIGGLIQPVSLHHCAHRAVDDHNALAQQPLELLDSV